MIPETQVSRHAYGASDDVYDPYDPATFTTSARQRQHSTHRPYSSNSVESHTRDPQRPLRRVHRQPEVRQSPHRRAVSLDAAGIPLRPAQSIPVVVEPAPSGIAALPPALSEAHTDNDGSTVDDPYQLLHTSYWPRRTARVSSRTASAILFTLEDAIRRPFPFTTDWEEVNASMSDMVGVAGPAAPVGNGRVQNGGTSRAPQGPVPVSSAHPPSGMRTPTDIMRQRRDREARRRAEQEARDKEQEELKRLQLGQVQQSQPQAEQYAAGVTANPPAQRVPRGPAQPVTATAAPGPAFQPTTSAAPSGRRSDYPSTQPTGEIPSQSRPPQVSGQQSLGGHGRTQSASAAGVGTQGPGLAKPAQPAQPETSQSLQQPRRAAFPHAFERWETLSSHWEGLTGYWIRKLEQNNEELEKDPLSQQLARQITDLSAAGANLFHAVVELQRLRASSERKFQRWFFDTRAEQERAKEVQADLDRQLKTERQGCADAVAAAQIAEKDKTRAEDLLREMRRELQISKEEARRAWEELGRREQEERDRTNSLRNGEPTLVGGVQVVPMIQGLPSRHNTRPPTREGPYPGGPTATSMGGGAAYQGKSADHGMSGQYYESGGTPMSPTESDPFTENQKPVQADPATSRPAYSEQYYESAHQGVPTTSEPDQHSYVGSSEAEDDFTHYTHDPQGSYPPALSEESDDYDQSPTDERHFVTEGGYTTSAASSAPVQAPFAPPTADYTGAGYGGWDSVTPRHRHPTRLSDVLEEDEVSRTSPSRASQASRGIL
ncbi:hypothetical protein N7510_000680 [Penicillium lagena]|uniref:uncharacterized protein n=1 Tax=Penicillium lagena TaxID=94218 RepID=UPI0025424F15|nr:uncharacterized protein N7510_000680 [Penicillium lagena]KAJ5624371.1 hypothetical protein N7510_000680 [Penicillium lagena]